MAKFYDYNWSKSSWAPREEDRTKAVENYRKFLSLWGNADPIFPEVARRQSPSGRPGVQVGAGISVHSPLLSPARKAKGSQSGPSGTRSLYTAANWGPCGL